MIVYDSKKWSSLFSTIADTFSRSYNLKVLAKLMILVTLYATVVTLICIDILDDYLAIDTVFFSLIGVILSLFLVFRLNTAYDRWWEGRKLWGQLVNDSRSLCLSLNALLPEDDRKRRRFFVRNISNFTMALQGHLRDSDMSDQFIHINSRYAEDIDQVDHVPNKIVSFMYLEIEHMYKEGVITDFDKSRMNDKLESFINILGGCERIKKTPIPFSHSTFIKMFTLIYLVILPFGLVDVFHHLTIPAVMIMGFALLGIEVVSEEIENPFGLEANSLPLGNISDGIRDSTYEILHVKSSFIPLPKSSSKTEILS